jgi:hypothetical protein
MKQEYSEYIVYGDESGDHSLKSIYPQHPVFVLALCVFSKEEYLTNVVTKFKKLKFAFWGHDTIVLHSAKLRRQIEDFQFLNNLQKRKIFIEAVNQTMSEAPFTIISTGMDKRLFIDQNFPTRDLYELSLEFCTKNIYRFLHERNQTGKLTHIIIESRGNEVDNELKIAFYRIVEKHREWQERLPLEIIFTNKKTNNIGLQIADLAAYPIGRFITDPQKENKSLDIIREKFYGYPTFIEKGLTIFPLEEKESLLLKNGKPRDTSRGLDAD